MAVDLRLNLPSKTRSPHVTLLQPPSKLSIDLMASSMLLTVADRSPAVIASELKQQYGLSDELCVELYALSRVSGSQPLPEQVVLAARIQSVEYPNYLEFIAEENRQLQNRLIASEDALLTFAKETERLRKVAEDAQAQLEKLSSSLSSSGKSKDRKKSEKSPTSRRSHRSSSKRHSHKHHTPSHSHSHSRSHADEPIRSPKPKAVVESLPLMLRQTQTGPSPPPPKRLSTIITETRSPTPPRTEVQQHSNENGDIVTTITTTTIITNSQTHITPRAMLKQSPRNSTNGSRLSQSASHNPSLASFESGPAPPAPSTPAPTTSLTASPSHPGPASAPGSASHTLSPPFARRVWRRSVIPGLDMGSVMLTDSPGSQPMPQPPKDPRDVKSARSAPGSHIGELDHGPGFGKLTACRACTTCTQFRTSEKTPWLCGECHHLSIKHISSPRGGHSGDYISPAEHAANAHTTV